MTWPDACFTNDTATGLAQATNKGMQKRLWRQLLTTTCLELVWTCPYQIGHQLPVKLMLLPSA